MIVKCSKGHNCKISASSYNLALEMKLPLLIYCEKCKRAELINGTKTS